MFITRERNPMKGTVTRRMGDRGAKRPWKPTLKAPLEAASESTPDLAPLALIKITFALYRGDAVSIFPRPGRQHPLKANHGRGSGALEVRSKTAFVEERGSEIYL